MQDRPQTAGGTTIATDHATEVRFGDDQLQDRLPVFFKGLDRDFFRSLDDRLGQVFINATKSGLPSDIVGSPVILMTA